MKKRWIIAFVFSVFLPLWMVSGQIDFYETREETFQAVPDRPLEVLLEVDAGKLIVEKGLDPYKVTVIMKYTDREFKERIDMDENKNRVKITLNRKNWFKIHHDRQKEDGPWAEVTVLLPYAVDILFDANIKAGEAQLVMDGIRLREFSMNHWIGELEVRFNEPNPIMMDFLDITAKVGETRLIHLGNAHFHRADINGGVGELQVDFTGDLQSQSQANIDLDIGEASVLLPQNMGVMMQIGGGFSFLSEKNLDNSFYKRGKTYYSDDYEEKEKKFFIRITPGLGDLKVDRE
ncbi:cell wall-active antibiotics response protein [bacterium]|nr:cell wall-active antibiotics response protein [bacterium]